MGGDARLCTPPIKKNKAEVKIIWRKESRSQMELKK
jgi:hypothetical protein